MGKGSHISVAIVGGGGGAGGVSGRCFSRHLDLGLDSFCGLPSLGGVGPHYAFSTDGVGVRVVLHYLVPDLFRLSTSCCCCPFVAGACVGNEVWDISARLTTRDAPMSSPKLLSRYVPCDLQSFWSKTKETTSSRCVTEYYYCAM